MDLVDSYHDLLTAGDVRDIGDSPTVEEIEAEVFQAIDRTDSIIRQLSKSDRMTHGTHVPAHRRNKYTRWVGRYDRLVLALCNA